MQENIYVNKYRKYLEFNRYRFESLLNKISQTESLQEKEKFASLATRIAVLTGTGYYSSDILEKVYTDIAKKSYIELPTQYKHGSFLHVITEAYAFGGHTRVMERWIAISAPNQTHSVVFTTNTTKHMPDALVNAVKNKNGTITMLDAAISQTDRALELRRIASSYEYIILHVHMDDPVPLIAFGTEDFTRPVIFFNHADHMFWLGVSITDIVADIKSLGRNITQNKRKASKSFLLNVPMSPASALVRRDKQDMRNKLGLPHNKKIILSYGDQHKYKPLLDLSFPNYISLISQRDDILTILIGREKKWYPELQSFAQKYPDKLIGLPRMPHSELLQYISAADLIVDSFPMPGITAIIDAVSAGIPVLSLRTLVGQQDYVIESKAYCTTLEELVEKSIKILDNPEAAEENIRDITQRLNENISADVFAAKLESLYKQTPAKHSLHSFKSEHPADFIECDVFAVRRSLKEKTLCNLFGIFAIIKRRDKVAKYTEYEIKVFKKVFFILFKKRLS